MDNSGISKMMISQEEIAKLPTTKDENYKYTNIQKLFEPNIAIAGMPTTQLENDTLYPNAHNIIFLNGLMQPRHIEGVKVSTLNKASSQTLQKFLPQFKDPLLTLNQTHAHNGYLIEIDAQIQSPLILQHFFDGVKGNLVSSHIVLWVKSGSVDLLELDHALEEESFIQNRFMTVVVEKNAICHHSKVNTLRKDQHSLNTTSVKVMEAGHYGHVLINAGGGTSRHNYMVSLEAPLAHTEIYGLYATSGNEHVDNQIYVHHKAPHTTSDQIFKGTLDGESRGIFTGMVRVEKHAQQISAKQLNKNLLLSPKAKAHSRPQLEIFADDVKCSHGSTTGQLSQDELFYFTSRGIKPEMAKRMLVRAMSYDILLKIKNQRIRNIVQGLVQGHIAS